MRPAEQSRGIDIQDITYVFNLEFSSLRIILANCCLALSWERTRRNQFWRNYRTFFQKWQNNQGIGTWGGKKNEMNNKKKCR